jgi:hypothetical protein
MAEASRLIKEATPLYAQVADGLDPMPTERPALQSLLDTSERARKKLESARAQYEEVKSLAPDAQVHSRRSAQLDTLLETLQSFSDELRAKLK